MLQGFDFSNDHWEKTFLDLVKGKGEGTAIVIEKEQQTQIRSAISFRSQKKEGESAWRIKQEKNLNKKNVQKNKTKHIFQEEFTKTLP